MLTIRIHQPINLSTHRLCSKDPIKCDAAPLQTGKISESGFGVINANQSINQQILTLAAPRAVNKGILPFIIKRL
uniref:ARAD1C07634p n=1 Tax=Blastobotrys adeninivorans TaxID=409370 RepID=A0A060SZG8_BLAAD